MTGSYKAGTMSARSETMLDANQYAAQGVGVDLLHTIMSMVGAVNAADIDIPAKPTGRPVAMTVEQLHQMTASMLAAEAGERYSLGDYELLSLRFVIEDMSRQAVTLLAVEDYHSPYPALVDGHMTSRRDAILAWLGDTDASEHPDLYLLAD